MKSEHFLKEGFVEDASDVHADHEVQMARSDLFHAAEDALVLHKLLRNVSEQQGLEGWVAAKITLASDYLKTVREYIEYELMTAASEQPMLPIAEGSTNDYFKRRKDEEDRIAGTKAPAKRTPQQSDYAQRRAQEKKVDQGVAEGSDDELNARPGMWRGDAKRMTAKGKPTKDELGMQDNLKNRIKASNKKGGLTGPKGVLPDQGVAEAAKWRDSKYKDRLYTQEPGDSDDYDNIGYGYDFPERPENDPGQKRRMGGVGSEFDRNDPLVKGQGIGRSGIKHSLNLAGKRKGLPSRDQITSLKGSIKDAHGKHRKPNLPEQGVAEGSSCNMTMEGKSCPMHGLKECPGYKSNIEETTAGSVATVVNPTPKNKSKVGTLFGGTYKQKKSK